MKDSQDGGKQREAGGQKDSAKERIIAAAWQLFHDRGYENTTVDDIIAISETSKGTFYYYFNTKDELLTTLSVVLDEHYEELAKCMDLGMNCFDQLLYLNAKMHKIIEEKINIELLASLYSTQLTAKGKRHLLDQNRVYYQMIQHIILEGQKSGQIRKDKTVNEIVNYYALCERALISDWCLNKGSYSLGEYSKEYMPIMMEHFRER